MSCTCQARLPPSPFLVSGLPCARALTSHSRVRESESTSKESFTIVDIGRVYQNCENSMTPPPPHERDAC